MILFAPCKINIGLNIIAKRDDGYHTLQTLMLPIGGLCDIVEVVRDSGDGALFSSSGLDLDCAPHNNLCMKAYELLKREAGIGGAKIHLHKKVCFGAGLGGGSSDAAYTLRALDSVFELDMGSARLESLGAQLGSDIPFFMLNEPQFATGRGEVLEPSDLDFKGYQIVIVCPPVHISTAEAYAGVTPTKPQVPLFERLQLPIARWRDEVKNDFEETVFEEHPLLADIKNRLYSLGAIYASMSGSGAALYGIFDHTLTPYQWPKEYFVYSGAIG